MGPAPKAIFLMILTTFLFVMQDGMSRYMAAKYGPVMIVMLRYWFFAAFVLALSASRRGGIRRVARTAQPWLQMARGVLLVAEICIAIAAFVALGLVEAHAIFATYPLMIAALSGFVLGEVVGWRRWLAIGVGMLGVLVILHPGTQVFSAGAMLALASALMFALYGLLTRYAARRDSAETSFFWTGIAGAVAISLAGPFFWHPIARADWGWMAGLAVVGALGHFTLIKAYALAQASTIQPFAYFQLVFASIIGVVVFHEAMQLPVILGAAIVVGAGIFTLWREKQAARKISLSPDSKL